MSTAKATTDIRVPERVRVAFLRAERESIGPEQDLFREIAARAVLDACGSTNVQSAFSHNRVVTEARTWLRFGVNREEILHHAGLVPEDIVKAVLATPKRVKAMPPKKEEA